MRGGFPVACLLVAGLSACGDPGWRWDKPGATDAAVNADAVDCHQAARQEAFRTYAFNTGFSAMGPGYWGFQRRPEYALWRQRLEADRFHYEGRLSNFCMRNKGYQTVRVAAPVAPPK